VREDEFQVTFQPWNRTVFVLAGTSIPEAAARAGLIIDTPCGGTGTCGKCRVQITQRASNPNEVDHRTFSGEELRCGWRLACQTAIVCNLVVHVPTASLFGGDQQIVRETSVAGRGEVLPSIHKVYVELTPPTLRDSTADLLRLEMKIGSFQTDLAMLRQVPRRLRAHGFKGTAVLSDCRLIEFEGGDTTNRCFGVAFDLGTTTMVASLVNLRSGRELAIASRMNPQVVFGDDVLARIKHSSSCAHGLDQLRRVVVEESARMIQALCEQTGVRPDDIYEVVFAGNTTMQHLLCGIDPSQLGEIPFAPAYARGLRLPPGELEMPINPRGVVYVFPVIGGFVGGDTVAGILATQLDSMDGPVLLIDIGTNGEIVLGHNGTLWAASTAAGPAFEGARISCGMRGTRGAIEQVILDEDVRLGVIDSVTPVGICGSGLIDLVAELLHHGIVSPAGRMLPSDGLPTGLPESLAKRVQQDDEGHGRFVLTDAGPDVATKALALTQRDVREFQLGCGAIRAGMAILLRKAGLSASNLETVLIGGGFGSFIRRIHAQRIGLIPWEIDHRRIRNVGNVSLAGARWALLSVKARERGEELARRTQHVELSNDADFQAEFAEAMLFPDQQTYR
jgi:uncharacterized 2Fe-2S/4Fe-4S cluster protein (DUF4445 family)